MREGFTKYHFGDGYAIHHFTSPDICEPHDHPGGFHVTIIKYGYVEEIYSELRGLRMTLTRTEGDTFYVPATRIHKIVSLPHGECVTAVKYEPHTRETHFWRWENGSAKSRKWNEEWN